MSRARLIFLAATWSMLACRPTPERPQVSKIGDPAPPKAPILETLTDYGAFEGDVRAGADVLPPGSVVSVGPSEHASIHQPVLVEFSTPMQDGVDVEFSFEPHVAGSAKWTSPTRLAFIPSHPFHSAHAYAVHITGTATTLGGQTIEVDRKLAFETPRPTADIDADYADYDRDAKARVSWKSGFTVWLSDETSETNVRDALRVTRDGRALPFRLEGEFDGTPGVSRRWRILPRGHWPAGATIRAELGASLKTIAGPLPVGAPVFATLQTREGVLAEVSCDESANDGCVIGSFELSFDALLPAGAAKQIRISPRPKGYDLQPWDWRDDRTFDQVSFFGEFEVGKTYTVTLGRGLRDVDGQSLAGKRTHDISFVAPPPTLDLRGLGTQLSGHGGMIGVESRSVQDAALVIGELDNWALASLVQRGHDNLQRPRRGIESREIKLDLTPAGTWGWDARAFDLKKEFGGPTGAAFFELTPGTLTPSQVGRADVESTNGLVQVTNLGVLVADSPAGGFVRVLSLDTADPVAGATAHVYGESFPPELIDSFGPSDAQGFIQLPKGTPLRGGVVHVVVVETKGDRVGVALEGPGHGPWRSWNEPQHGDEFDIGVIMSDRELYQPGERMRVMGWTARSTVDTDAGIEGSGTRAVTVKVEDRDGNVLARSKVRTKAYGKFWATLDLPENARLGSAEITAEVDGEGSRAFTRFVQLREFVAPAFDVSLALDDTELSHGQDTRAVAMARYLHGMPLPVEVASEQVYCRPSTYRPVDAKTWNVASPLRQAHYTDSSWKSLKTVPSHAKGRVSFDVDFGSLTAGHPYRCDVSLLVMDAARQELATTTRAWVHPSRYLLVDPSQGTRVGQRHVVRAKAVLPSGDATTAKPATADIYRLLEHGTATRAHGCRLEFDKGGEAQCAWTPRKPGRYEVRFSASVDGTTVQYRSELYVRRRLLADGGDDEIPFEVVVPKSAKAGSMLDVEVQTKYPTGRGLAVEVHAGVRGLHPFEVRGHQGRVSLKAAESWTPRGYIDTFVVHPDGKRRLPRIERSFDNVYLGYESRALEVEVSNPKVSSVGATLPIDVSVLGSEGHPVEDAHVSVWAVDEGILMLRDWRFPDFTEALTFDRGNEAHYFDGYDRLRRPYFLRRDPFEPSVAGGHGFGSVGGGVGGGGHGAGGGTGSSARPKTRSNFDPAPIFIGDVKTGPDGTARVHGVLPDNLTTFRIAAVATAEVPGTGAFARAGRDESQVRVTQDLAIRPVLPRMLRPGDTAQLGVLVDNLTDVPGTLEIETELRDAQGIARITSEARRIQRLDEPQARVSVDVEALRDGELRVWVHARLRLDDGRVLEDASELPLEVRTERTLIRHAATYGSMLETEVGAVALAVPPHVPASAEADVSVYASMLGGYQGAARDLVTYPYGCVEQTSSRLVPLAALHGLAAFDLGAGDVQSLIKLGMLRLETMVTRGGGFAYWPNGKTPHVYATAYATWVLSELKRAGIEVDEDMLEGAAAYLDTELAELRSRATPTGYEDTRAAMALLAVTAVGRSNPAVMKDLLARLDTLPAFARAILAMALHAADPSDPRLPELLDSLRDRIELRGKIARSQAESKRYAEYFDTPLRTDAMMLLAFVRAAPDDPLIEPLARGLTEARNRGRLRTTQENAYALLAMSGYAGLREAVEPDMDVRAWIGADMVLETRFEGRDLSVLEGEAVLHEGDPLVTLQRTGEGRLYYRVGMQWAPDPRAVEPRARGIAIERTIFDRRGELGDRSLVAGQSGTLEVTVSADARQRYVAIEVPIPAGIEPVDRTLGRGGVTKHVVATPGAALLPYDHHELRGDRVLVFVDHLPAGTYRYRVPIRATHEGTYSMPPATAHAMYAPEIEGNTAGDVVGVVSP